MEYTVVSQKTGIVFGERLTRNDPTIRVQEGKPHGGSKHPLDLLPGESTVVSYPLTSTVGFEHRSLICKVMRTDGAVPEQKAPVLKVATRTAPQSDAAAVRVAMRTIADADETTLCTAARSTSRAAVQPEPTPPAATRRRRAVKLP